MVDLEVFLQTLRLHCLSKLDNETFKGIVLNVNTSDVEIFSLLAQFSKRCTIIFAKGLRMMISNSCGIFRSQFVSSRPIRKDTLWVYVVVLGSISVGTGMLLPPPPSGAFFCLL